MKIRTDFVTNSSSSSFVTARIDFDDSEAINLFKELITICDDEVYWDITVKGNSLYIHDQEDDFGLYDPMTPEELMEHLLPELCNYLENNANDEDFFNSPQIKNLMIKLSETAKHIISYDIESGEEGNMGENDSLAPEYLESLCDTDEDGYIDEDMLDKLWEEYNNCEDWSKRINTFTWVKGQNQATKETRYSGPLDYKKTKKAE